tara:strand:- start:188 stop:502 length:315 start_codon:yes stop_codon:yes gene_type:complete
MNQQQRKQFYPQESYNNRVQCEQRWNENNNIYVNDSADWNIVLGNGKRLNRKWRKCGGLAYVRNQHGEFKSIYNENFDRDLQEARYDTSLQPDGNNDFYTTQQY